MKIAEVFEQARYVVDPQGKRTDVLIPVEAWEQMRTDWEKLVELLEDQEDLTILSDWLEKRASGRAHSISLNALEDELRNDGLLSG